jgi:hypothetical protein
MHMTFLFDILIFACLQKVLCKVWGTSTIWKCKMFYLLINLVNVESVVASV